MSKLTLLAASLGLLGSACYVDPLPAAYATSDGTIACYDDTGSPTWTAPAPSTWSRQGWVESVREIANGRVGNPAGSAAGALIGGAVFGGQGPPALISATGDAASRAAGDVTIGEAAGQSSAESRTCEVLVRFDDGAYGLFVYGEHAPFGVGDAVVLTPRGLGPARVALTQVHAGGE
jgi:outer membrane lipoprotein SlyB